MTTALETKIFEIPVRDWDIIIHNYNDANYYKFKLEPVQCSSIIDYVKKGIPPKFLFKSLGFNYGYFRKKYDDMIADIETYSQKKELTDSEIKSLERITTNPLFILMGDIDRATGSAAILDYMKFNENANDIPSINLEKMKALYKDMFGEKEANNTINVNIKLGADFINDI